MSSNPESALAIPLMRGILVGTLIGLLIMETVHAGLSMKIMDYYLIANYGDERVLSAATWYVTFIIGLLLDFIIYLRVFKPIFRWVFVFMSTIAAARTGISIVPCIWCVLAKSWVAYRDETRKIILAGNILFIIGDTFSASILIYYLYQSRIGQCRTDRLINRLLLYAMATGALTSLVDITALIVTLVQPNSLAFMGVILVQTQRALNVRHSNLRALDGPTNTNIELPPVSVQFARPRPRLSSITEQSDRSDSTMMNNARRKSTAESWHTALTDSSIFTYSVTPDQEHGDDHDHDHDHYSPGRTEDCTLVA
ncbi:hypothetical protein BJ138DRAFT_1142326 [Hygrophoropsis aurantiaca]|uniref:Uncharacterized protein n=1 Tax=Hygrophoropsis aurantiaca TaxID=72124 RepID=A0ACB8API9_9AGAM|nr:hypothetical protein BJ138DRAFT_1142326 [Hygrophoropsis aurantiaca]